MCRRWNCVVRSSRCLNWGVPQPFCWRFPSSGIQCCVTGSAVSLAVLCHCQCCVTVSVVSLSVLCHWQCCVTVSAVSLAVLCHCQCCVTVSAVSLSALRDISKALVFFEMSGIKPDIFQKTWMGQEDRDSCAAWLHLTLCYSHSRCTCPSTTHTHAAPDPLLLTLTLHLTLYYSHSRCTCPSATHTHAAPAPLLLTLTLHLTLCYSHSRCTWPSATHTHAAPDPLLLTLTLKDAPTLASAIPPVSFSCCLVFNMYKLINVVIVVSSH